MSTTTAAPAGRPDDRTTGPVFDLIIIGAGPAGYVAAERAGAAGKRVLLIEREEHLGGVCLNWGCVPTKALLACAKMFYHASHGDSFGVTGTVQFDFAKALTRKQKTQDGLRAGIKGLMKKFKVEVVRGEAKLTAKNAVTVGATTYTAANILVCTGSRPAKPPIPGLTLPHVCDSSAILELTALPKRLVIIGGGVIGVEFACFFASVGVAVEVVELLTEITPGIDPDCAKTLRAELTAKGVTFHLGRKVAKVTAEAVHHTDAAGADEKAIAADRVLVCIGRTPNTDGLGLEAVGVDVRNRIIQVDERCRTNVPGIYAAGDCASRIMLAHVGSRMGEVAVRDMLGDQDRMRWHAIPGVIYTSPEVAGVGLTEAQAKEQGIAVTVASWNLAANGRFLAEFTGKGLIKAILRKEDGVLLGVHGVGGGVSEQVAGWAAMIEAEFRLRELTELVFPHPTVSEALRDAAWTVAH